ncbi:MAG TPA: hypothetical protein VEY92_01200 [Pseudoxanthomonas sp.]|nr:hypothetical protein [Pseudoxanthomonas sp.]
MQVQSLTPKLREAVQAIAADPERKRVRVGGGYIPRLHPQRVITKRAIAMLDRAYITRFQGDMDAEVALTGKGEQIANERARAGVK